MKDAKRTELRMKQDFLLMLTAMRNLPESMLLTEGGPRLDQLRRAVYPEWEGTLDQHLRDFSRDLNVGLPDFTVLAEKETV